MRVELCCNNFFLIVMREEMFVFKIPIKYSCVFKAESFKLYMLSVHLLDSVDYLLDSSDYLLDSSDCLLDSSDCLLDSSDCLLDFIDYTVHKNNSAFKYYTKRDKDAKDRRNMGRFDELFYDNEWTLEIIVANTCYYKMKRKLLTV